jgi:phosphatidylinositol alpha-1,6-mannosyltransferase
MDPGERSSGSIANAQEEDILLPRSSAKGRRGLQTPVLMITELFLPTKGGTAVSFDDDFRRLGGKEVHIVTADVPGAAEFDRAHANSIHRLGLGRIPWLKPESLLVYAKLSWTALRLAARHRFVAIFAGRVLPEGFVAWLVGRLTGRPVLVYAHGEELTGWGRGRKFQASCFVLRRADRVLSNSDFTRDTLVNLLGVDPDRIELVYPTVDETRFLPNLLGGDLRASLGIGEGQKLILSVGRIMLRKGFDNVIRALPRLLADSIDVHYAVIGIGEQLETLRALAHEHGVSDRVHLLGHVSYEDLPRWYCASDVFAMPNRDIGGDTEGFGLVFLEAASSGRPSLAGIAGGTGSAVVDGVTGVRVDGERVEAIAEGLARLLTQPALAAQMGLRGRARVLEHYTHQRRVDQLRALALRGRYRAAPPAHVQESRPPTA